MFEFDDGFSDLAKIKIAYIGDVSDFIDVGINGVEFVSIDDKSDDEINDALKGSDLVFIIAGAQTSSIAEISRELGAMTIAIVKEELGSNTVDTFFVVSDNNKSVIPQIIKAISDLIAVPGLVNLDFADVKSILGNAGKGYVGTGEAVGKNATVEAVKAAISDIGDISKSRSLMLNILGSVDSLSMMEVNEASITLQEAVHEDAEIIWGVSVDESFGDKIKATLIATNLAD